MTKSFDTLVEDIYSLVTTKDIKVSEEETGQFIEQFKNNIGNLVLKQLSLREGGDTLRFSNLGYGDRKLWYKLKSGLPPEEFEPQTIIKFMYGDIIEELVLLLAKLSGHTVSGEQDELELEGVKGHRDAVIDGVLVDVKSASKYSFDRFDKGTLADNDSFGYITQLSAYAQADPNKPRAAFIAVGKELGKITTLEIKDQPDVRQRIKHLKEVLDSETVPDRCHLPVPDGKSGNLKLNTNCSYCSFKEHCWADANNGKGLRTFLYSTGPVDLVLVERTPNVPEVQK